MKFPRNAYAMSAVFVGLVFCSSVALAQAAIDTYNSTGVGRIGTIQTFVVPAGVTTVIIEASGAEGGGTVGGLGASIEGDFAVTPGETLSIIVGQFGHTTAQGNYGGGGGGASYIYRNASDAFPMIAASGGGGGSEHGAGSHGSATTTPTPGGVTGSGAGGVTGNGGSGGLDIGNYSTAGGGAGWLSNGLDGLLIREPEGKGGQAPRNGALGGEFTHRTIAYHAGEAGNGGFGGGGGMSDNSGAGGGGGGFNGGGGGNNYDGTWGTGGGGGSYNGGSDQTNIGGVQSGDGVVTISYVAGVAPPAAAVPSMSVWALIIFSMLLLSVGLVRIRHRN